MGRKRTRRTSSDEDSDDWLNASSTSNNSSSRRYGLRPRRTPTLLTEEMVDEEDNEYLSDFEEELKLPKSIPQSNLTTDPNGSVDYDDIIQPGVVFSKNPVDFEDIIKKSEIKVNQLVNTEDVSSSSQKVGKRRGRKPKWLVEKEQANLGENEKVDEEHESATENASEDIPENGCEEQGACENSPKDVSEQNENVELNKSDSEVKKLKKYDVEEIRKKYWLGLSQAIGKDYFLECTEHVAILKEKLAKAKFHYVIIPRQHVKGVTDLNSRHIEILRQLLETASNVMKYPQHENRTFLVGFNLQSTEFNCNKKFQWLHLHVISDDMLSDNLSLKSDWNEIHSCLFVHPNKVIKQLEEKGKVAVPPLDDCTIILNGEMKCHKCDFSTSSIVSLKKHIENIHNC